MGQYIRGYSVCNNVENIQFYLTVIKLYSSIACKNVLQNIPYKDWQGCEYSIFEYYVSFNTIHIIYIILTFLYTIFLPVF